MTLIQIITNLNLLEFIASGSGIALLIMTLVQISPIKLNPWTYIAKAIGKSINGELIKKIDNMEKELKEFRKDSDDRDATLRRTHILRFNDEILHEKEHTKEHFDEILDDIDYYEQYCAENKDYKNNKGKLAIENIKNTYNTCTKKNSFL